MTVFKKLCFSPVWLLKFCSCRYNHLLGTLVYSLLARRELEICHLFIVEIEDFFVRLASENPLKVCFFS